MNRVISQLAAGAAIAAAFVAAPAYAQERDFSIPAQDIAEAVPELARQADVQIIVSADAAQGKRSQAVSGSMTVERALQVMLAGTGLRAQSTGARTFVVVAGEPASSHSAAAYGSEAAAPVNQAILVTATRREENLQDVPLAVTAVTGEQIEERGTTELFELARSVPGLTVSAFSEAEPIIAVRGATNTFSQAGASKPVGVFIDDVYISRNSASTFQLFDLESVEVLRGPQGTLFGRNVTGGAIVVNTARPSLTDTTVRAEAGYGNYDAMTLRALVNGPLGENAAAKLSANYVRRDGYSTDRLIGREADDLEAVTVRGAFLFEPADTLEVTLAADYGRENTNGRALSAISPTAADDGDPRTTETGFPQRYERETYGLSGTVNVDTMLGEFTSITAYRHSDAKERLAFSPVAFDLLAPVNAAFPFQRVTDNADTPATFSQELRLVSDPGSPFGYVAGLYYFQENIDRDATTLQFTAGSGSINRDRTFFQQVGTKSYAAYLNLSYDLSDWLTLTAGGRYTFEEKDVEVDYVDRLDSSSSFSDARFSGDYEEFTPRVALEAEPTEDLLLYASYTQGFTAGGFNTEEPSIAVIADPFAPETIDAYEIGMKSQWLDRRVTLNLAGFIQEYKDKQEGFLNSDFNFVIRNAAEATIKGIEAEAAFIVVPGVTLSGSYAYLDARYDTFLIDLNDEDRSGNFLNSAPEHSFAIGLDGDIPLTDTIDLVAHAEYSWQDDYFTGSENRDTFLIEAYDLANASLGFEDADGHWRALLWADNIFDKQYVLIRSIFGLGGVGEAHGAPATYGVRVGFDF